MEIGDYVQYKRRAQHVWQIKKIERPRREDGAFICWIEAECRLDGDPLSPDDILSLEMTVKKAWDVDLVLLPEMLFLALLSAGAVQ